MERDCRGAALSVATRLLPIFLVACATIPLEQCPGVDWMALGVEDGRQGYAESRLEAHRRACAKAGVVPDAVAWESGRRLGLERYCQPGNAISEGLARRSYANTCDDPLFAELYAAARRVGDARSAVQSIDQDLDAREQRLLRERKLDDKARAALRSEIRQLERRRDRLRDDQRDAERALERLRDRTGF